LSHFLTPENTMCRKSRSAADAADQSAEEYTMPCAEAMLAGTLALMTGYAQQQDAGVRSLMARKVVSNLFFLSGHPHLSDAFRTMLVNLRARWQTDGPVEATGADTGSTSESIKIWHSAPVHVQ